MRHPVGLLLLAIVVAALPVSCQNVLGIETLPGKTFPAAETETCGQCVAGSCAAVRDACLADAKCAELYTCVAKCGLDTMKCRALCERDRPAIAQSPLYRALDGCRRTDCTDECYGIGGFGVTAHAACGCTDAVCAPFIRNCIRSGSGKKPATDDAGVEEPPEVIGDCERRVACFANRPLPIDPEDSLGCVLERTGGMAEMNAVRFCWQGATCAACETCASCPMPGGGLDECIGGYQWKRPEEEVIKFTLGIQDQQGREVEGAVVDACGAADCGECKAPVDSGPTDANGNVELSLSTFGVGFRGCFQIRAPGKVNAIWYTGRPLMRSEAILNVPMLTEAELSDYAKAVTPGVDPTRGTILIATRDCIFAPASRLTVAVPPGSDGVASYLINGLPSTTGATDDSGRAALVNVLPGKYTVVMSKGKAEYGRLEVYARADWITGMFMFPNVSTTSP